ncbi:MAG: YggS family pyridoxal phosphate-dependent enzyme [Clostridiales bacterium]|jgi:pyridoxal phosphate enzyme (YggS family)|nr:YggS family pyridoxal phosphate-dependent enzyme [Clostridiales bacterium]
MSNIRDNIARINENKPDDVLLVAVTKTRSAEEINKAIDCGITDIGENKVQEILEKYDYVKPVRWHMIGHLQTNKVKYIIDKVSLIHSVDSLKLAKEINRRAGNKGITMDVLIQVNVAQEDSKYGIDAEEAVPLIEEILKNYENIRVRGLMTIAPFEENPEDVRKYFKQLKALYDSCATIKHERLDFKYLSMGMTNDYEVAIEEGSNLIRIGTAIFGERKY